MLENGTRLDLSELKEDFVVSVTIPIRDLDLANFDYAQQFANNGYDIYDKNSNFYIDPCTAAFIHKDDIPLKDRKKDIYPNVTICKGTNCQYKEANLEDRRIVCECNLNTDKISDTQGEDDFMEPEEEVTNYILDNINYRIIKCYYLLLDFKNLVKNPAFYVLSLIFVAVLFCSFKFMFFGIRKIRINIYNELPTEANVNEEAKAQLKRMKENIEQISVEKKRKSNPPKKDDDEKEIIEENFEEKKDKKSKKIKKRKRKRKII